MLWNAYKTISIARELCSNVLRSAKNTLKANKMDRIICGARPMPCVCRFIHKNQFARGVWLNQTINMYAVIIYRRKMEKIKGPINIYKYCKSTEIRGINRCWKSCSRFLHFLPAHVFVFGFAIQAYFLCAPWYLLDLHSFYKWSVMDGNKMTSSEFVNPIFILRASPFSFCRLK